MSLLGNILIIDDDANLRTTLALILQHAGLAVTAAASAKEGLSALAREAYDLIFLDIKMPGMDGLTLLPQLRQRYPRTPVIIITGYASPESIAEISQKGACGFLAKPVDPERILARVRAVLVEKRLPTSAPVPAPSPSSGSSGYPHTR